jgi:hypothetical protein
MQRAGGSIEQEAAENRRQQRAGGSREKEAAEKVGGRRE